MKNYKTIYIARIIVAIAQLMFGLYFIVKGVGILRGKETLTYAILSWLNKPTHGGVLLILVGATFIIICMDTYKNRND